MHYFQWVLKRAKKIVLGKERPSNEIVNYTWDVKQRRIFKSSFQIPITICNYTEIDNPHKLSLTLTIT